MPDQGQSPNPFEIRPKPSREAERDVPPLSVDYTDGEPEANKRSRALMFGDKLEWWTYIGPINADTTPASELEYVIVIRAGATRTMNIDEIRARYGVTELATWYADRRKVARGRVQKLRADEVLPFVRGVALVHGMQDEIDYREGLT